MGLIKPLQTISEIAMVAPVIVGGIRFPRLKTEGKILLLLVVITVISEGYNYYCLKNGLNYYWTYYLYAPIEFSLVVYVFSRWQRNKGFTRALRWSIVGFIVICIIDMLASRDMRQINNWVISLSFLVYLLVTGATLLQLKQTDSGWLVRDLRFWISASFLLYAAGGLVYFIFFPALSNSHMVTAWIIYSITNTLANLLIGMGLLCQCPE